MTVEREYEVVVIGSGGTGLTAALASADKGAKVAVLEAHRTWGGTTGFCGGQLWVPNHHHLQAAGTFDSRENILTYLKECMPDRDDQERWEAFVDQAPRMLRFLEEKTPLRFSPVYFPDSFADQPGGSTGRQVEPRPLKMSVIGPWKEKLIDQQGINDSAPFPLTYAEISAYLKQGFKVMVKKSLTVPFRLLTGRVTQQRALLAGLLKGCLDRGVELILETRARELVVEDGGRVKGVKARSRGKEEIFRAGKAVILASGGFSWNQELKEEFLPGPMDHSMTPPTNQGDAVHLARQVGARLHRMDEAWYWAALHKPGMTWEGAPLGLIAIYVRTLPHTMVVNRFGRRFVNESAHNMANAFYEAKDPETGELLNYPAWAIFDQRWRDSSSEFAAGIAPGKPDPEILIKAGTIRELAGEAGIDPEGLTQTVERFNGFVAQGKDLDFQRGETTYDKFYTQTRLYGSWEEGAATKGNLGSIEKPPFYAVRLYASSVGTKGGAMTDAKWRVVKEDGSPVPGLYAVGNCSAAIIGPITVAAASTLGTGMTAAYIAGRSAAGEG